MTLKRVDSYCEDYEQMCSQTWGIVLYFLGLMPSRVEWESSEQLQDLIPDLPTWMYHIQAMATHYQRLQREKKPD